MGVGRTKKTGRNSTYYKKLTQNWLLEKQCDTSGLKWTRKSGRKIKKWKLKAQKCMLKLKQFGRACFTTPCTHTPLHPQKQLPFLAFISGRGEVLKGYKTFVYISCLCNLTSQHDPLKSLPTLFSTTMSLWTMTAVSNDECCIGTNGFFKKNPSLKLRYAMKLPGS